MFTGLVEQLGKVESIEDRRGQRKIQIKTQWNDLAAGESVSVSGVCLTVTDAGPKGEASFFVSEETLERSNLAKLEAGSKVNLERAMQFGGRMGGHWVQGHVDAKGMVLNNVEGPDHHRVTVALDPKYGKYCVEKGSISIDGVSLTINTITETRNKEFMVSFVVIPHTWKHTTISQLKTGDAVNVEVDILAKYIERLCPQWEAGVIQGVPQSLAPAQSVEAQQTAGAAEEAAPEEIADVAQDAAPETTASVVEEAVPEPIESVEVAASQPGETAAPQTIEATEEASIQRTDAIDEFIPHPPSAGDGHVQIQN